ncbi:MAG: UDP-N-acetylmuramate--L-alanine ligase [Candidatus Daviesbacteria bacterium]|nr:UDP-N-acetylmuramate--L-alanine ligase [Candidatus Daviesbacteria bacterium]
MKDLKVHFLGIGGSGASAVASIAQNEGFAISGCDKNPFNEFTKVFDAKKLFEGHSPEHLKDIDILTVTPAIYSLDPNNPELEEAKKLGIPILTWQEFMGKYLEKDKFVIAICGTHGKTTTTAMIGQLLEDAGFDPTVEVGAIVPKWGTNYRLGKGKYFITEADEFNDNFLVTHPDITICTTIEMDHPEYFKDFESYKKSFKKFLSQTKEKIIANLSDKGIMDVIARSETTKQSRSEIASPASLDRNDNIIDNIIDYSEKLIDFPLQIPGKHNILNASAVFQLGLSLKIDPEIIKKSLMNFSGVGRRFEKIGELNGAQIISDFAHHPTEIKVTLEGAKEKFPDKKIILVFQPHMFSRTKALFDDFVKVLKNSPAERTYILDIFPSREVDTGLVNTQQLVDAINQENVKYINSYDKLLDLLPKEIKEDNLVIFMGAGDNHKLALKLMNPN